MKKYLALFLVLMMVMGMAACGKEAPKKEETAGQTVGSEEKEPATTEPEGTKEDVVVEQPEGETDEEEKPDPSKGEPITGGSLSKTIGSYTLTADFIPMAEPLVTEETFDHDFAIIGDKAYLLEGTLLREYAYDGSTLTLTKETELDGEYDVLEEANGQLILSSFMKPVIGHDGSAVTFTAEGPDYLAVAPDGTWGISYFSSGDDCEKYSIADGTLTAAGGFPFTEFKTISTLRIDEEYVYVTGYAVDDSGHIACIYDHSGALQMILQQPDEDFGLGSVTYVTKTANGFFALDGNMRTIVLWAPDGTCIGYVEDADLFNTGYPWFCTAQLQPDGSIVCIMTEDRADETAMELIAFKITGF